ncbi:MAG: DUF1553 domain-containing protein, partial [Akkermansiaceae bacterium]|nr:DUF1553 domain-containing protein [Akkermansiaceae bacterium]
NRIWGYLLGTGVIEPLDDIRAGNPPSNPELLEWLTTEFIGHDFDVRHLIGTICKSRTYQLSIETNEWNADDEINFSHAKARRLPAEVLFDAVYAVTGTTPKIPGAKPGTRAQQLDDVKTDLKSGFLANLGRPARESACECDRSNDVQLGAVMALLSGPTVADAIGDEGNAIAKLVAATPDDRELIEKIFLRVLSRNPTSEQVEAALANWAGIESDHQRLQQELAAKEKEWIPVRDQREAARAARLKEANDAVAAYQPAHDKERKRLGAERAKREAAAKAAVEEIRGKLPALAREAETKLTVNRLWTPWHPLVPATATASDKSKVEILPDGSVRGAGKARALDYLLTGEATLRNITGIMIESVPDETFPTFAAGLNPDGNFVVTEVQARWKSTADPKTEHALAFSDAWADFNQEGFDVKGAIDGKVDRGNKGWALSGANLQVPHRAAFKLKEIMAGDADGATLTVGVLSRYNNQYPIGRFRIWVTDAKDPLSPGLPAEISAIVSTLPDRRSAAQRATLQEWVAANDAEFQKRRGELIRARDPVAPDQKMAALKAAVVKAERPIMIDPRVIRIREDLKMSAAQLENRRLTAAQDLTWALINNPAFLFNY